MNDATAILVSRVFLPCQLVAFVLLTYVLPVATFRRRHGVDPDKVAVCDPLMLLTERYRNAILVVTFLLAFAHAIQPSALGFLPPIAFLEGPWLRFGGMALMAAAIYLIRLGQRHLKASWRIGFDRTAPATELVTGGIYAHTRNPIHLGLLLMVLGLLLVLPNAVTLAIAAITLVVLQVRTVVEEQYLVSKHGGAYLAYCDATPRWFFRPAPPAQPATAEEV